MEEIFEYVLEHSGPDRAIHVHKSLHEGMSMVGAEPGVGHIRDDLGDESLRVFSVFSFLVIYRPETRPVQVIAVVHGARDMPAAIEDRY